MILCVQNWVRSLQRSYRPLLSWNDTKRIYRASLSCFPFSMCFLCRIRFMCNYWKTVDIHPSVIFYSCCCFLNCESKAYVWCALSQDNRSRLKTSQRPTYWYWALFNAALNQIHNWGGGNVARKSLEFGPSHIFYTFQEINVCPQQYPGELIKYVTNDKAYISSFQ